MSISTKNRYIKGVTGLGALGDLYEQNKYVSSAKATASSLFMDEVVYFDIDPETLVVYDLQGVDKSMQVQGETIIVNAFEQGVFASLLVSTLKNVKPVKTLILEKAEKVLSPDAYKKVFLKVDWADPATSFRLQEGTRRV